MKKIICYFSSLCIVAFCSISVYAAEICQIVANGIAGLGMLIAATKVAVEMLKIIVSRNYRI